MLNHMLINMSCYNMLINMTQARASSAGRPLGWSSMCRGPASATPMRSVGATPPRQLAAQSGKRGSTPLGAGTP